MEYAEIFDGMRFNTGPETWVAAVENKPAPVECSDRVCFVLRFTPDGRMSGSQERRLKLWHHNVELNSSRRMCHFSISVYCSGWKIRRLMGKWSVLTDSHAPAERI